MEASALEAQPALTKPGELPPPEAIVKAFESTRSLIEFAKVFYFDRTTAVKALATAGIDIHEEVARARKSGSNMRELSVACPYRVVRFQS